VIAFFQVRSTLRESGTLYDLQKNKSRQRKTKEQERACYDIVVLVLRSLLTQIAMALVNKNLKIGEEHESIFQFSMMNSDVD